MKKIIIIALALMFITSPVLAKKPPKPTPTPTPTITPTPSPTPPPVVVQIEVSKPLTIGGGCGPECRADWINGGWLRAEIQSKLNIIQYLVKELIKLM